MGYKIGLVAILPASNAMGQGIMKHMFYEANVMETRVDSETAFALPEERAMVGATKDRLFIISKSMCYSIVSRPDFMPLPEDEAWLLEQSRDRTIVLAYMHSIAEICGYVVFAGGDRIASHFHIDGEDTFGPEPESYPDWLTGAPKTYTYEYVSEVIEAFIGMPLHEALDEVEKWELYAVN